MKKIITLLLALVMVVACFAACNNTKQPSGGKETPKETPSADPGDGDETPGDNDEGGEEIPENQKLNIDLESIDYGGDTFYIYHWNTTNPEFSVEKPADEVADPVTNAVYEKNLFTEEGLGIKLDFHGEDGTDNKQENFISKLKTRMQNPETPVDLIAAYSRTAPYVLKEGYAVDLYTYSSDLDLSKAWWPELVRETHEIKGRLFYTSGDASTGLLTMIETLFVNKDMLKAKGEDYDEFMNKIKKGEWYLDDLITLTTGVYQEADTIPGESKGDIFGIVAENVGFGDGMWTAYGYKLFDISDDDDKIYTLSNDLLGENASNFVAKMTEWSNTKDAHLYFEGGDTTVDKLTVVEKLEHFSAGKALFMEVRIGLFTSSGVEVKCDYTAVPFPKGDTKQTRYYTCVGNPYSLFSICTDAEDKDKVAEVLQTMGYYGYTLTSPALFEVTFKGIVAKDDYAIEMFDIIRNNITFEIGRTFDRLTGTMLPNLVSRAWCNNITWTTQLSPNKKTLYEGQVQQINKQILDIIAIAE